jgi:hypothetical protein
MNRPPRLHDANKGSFRARPLRAALPELGKCRWYSEHRSCPPRAILESKQTSEIGLADAHCVLQHRSKDRLQFAWRTRDDLQHIRGRGLLLQRLGKLLPSLGEFAPAFFELVFQTGRLPLHSITSSARC